MDTCKKLLDALTAAGLSPRANGDTPCLVTTTRRGVVYRVVCAFARVQPYTLDSGLQAHGWRLVGVTADAEKRFITVAVCEVKQKS